MSMPRRDLVSLLIVTALIVGFAAIGIVHTLHLGMHHDMGAVHHDRGSMQDGGQHHGG